MGIAILIGFLLLGVCVYALCRISQRADIEMEEYWGEQQANKGKEEPLFRIGVRDSRDELSKPVQERINAVTIHAKGNSAELNQLCIEFLQRYFTEESKVGDSVLVPIDGIGMCYIEKVGN